MPAQAQSSVSALGSSSGWYSDDTRSAAGVTLNGLNSSFPGYFTYDGAPSASTADDASIASQLFFTEDGTVSGGGAGVMVLDGTTANSGKTSVRYYGDGTGLGVLDNTFSSSYRWYMDPDTTSRTVALNLLVLGTDNLVYSLSWLQSGSAVNSWHEWSVTASTPVDEGGNGWRVYGNGAPGSATGGAKSLNDWLTDPTYGAILNGGTVLGQGFNLGSYQRNCRVGIDWLESSLIDNGNRVDFTAPPVTVCASGCDFTTIRAAVEAAAAGDVIEILAGEYNEPGFAITKAITLKGAKAGVDGRTRGEDETGETVLTGTGRIFDLNASGITLDGLFFRNLNHRGLDSYSNPNDFTVKNCVFQVTSTNTSGGAIQFGGGSSLTANNFLFEQNLVTGSSAGYLLYFLHSANDGVIQNNTLNSRRFMFGPFGQASGWEIASNLFDGEIGGTAHVGYAINAQFGNAVVHGNTFRKLTAGLQLSIVGGEVTNNTFDDNNNYGLELFGGAWGSPVSSDVLISNNTFSYNGVGSNARALRIGRAAGDANSGLDPAPGIDGATLTIENNVFVDLGFTTGVKAIEFLGSNTIDAACNWWGQDGNPLAQLSGNVSYTPWLTSGTDSDGAEAGFQPASGTCVGGLPVKVYANSSATESQSAHATIQEAIDAATTVAGNVIVIANGTYTMSNTLVVDKEVVLQGESMAGVILDASGMLPLTKRVIETDANNITLRNLTIKPIADPDPTANNNIGFTVKVGSNSVPAINSNIVLENIAIDGAPERTPFDFHGVDGLTLTNISVSGTTRGNGMSFSGCTDVTVNSFSGTQNAWGSIAVYASRFVPAGGRGSSNIIINGAGLDIDGNVFSQDDLSATQGDLFNTNVSVTGWDFKVFNDAFRGPANDSEEYTFFSADASTAAALAASLNTGNTTSTMLQVSTGDWVVAPGMDINEAIADASVDGQITLLAGTHNLSEQVLVAKDLTILGAEAGTTIKAAFNATGGSSSDPALIKVPAGVELDLSDITLDGGFPDYQVRMGIVTYGTGGSIHDNTIQNFRTPGYDGRGVVVYGTDIAVEDNTFSNIGRIGIHIRKAYSGDAVATNITASGNAYTGKGSGDWLDYGIEVGAAASATLTDNTITQCLGVASTDGSTSAGILATDYYGTGTTVTATGNILSGNSSAIAIGYAAADVTTVTLNRNDLSGSVNKPINATANVVVNASCNWFGSSNYNDFAASLDSDVAVIPFLTSNDLVNGLCDGDQTSTLLNESFDEAVVLGASNSNEVWYVDRYAPDAFESFDFQGENVLRIATSLGASERGAQSAAFYNTHGRKFNQGGLGATTLSGKLYIPQDWASAHRRSGVWATMQDANGDITAYPILSFRNVDAASPKFSFWTNAGWSDVTDVAPNYDGWNQFDMELRGGAMHYYINGQFVGSNADVTSTEIQNVILQIYNFDDASLSGGQYDPGNAYEAYWDDIATSTGGPVHNLTAATYHGSIQAAIDAASAGDLIDISAGTYAENVTLNKRLTLSGAGATTILNTTTNGAKAITVTASGSSATDRVVIQNLAFTGPSNTGGSDAISFEPAGGSGAHVTVENISVTGHGQAVHFRSGTMTDARILNSTLNGNANGVRVATAVTSMDGLTVDGCTMNNNNSSAFTVNPSGVVSNVNTNYTISNSTFANNSTGAYTNQHDISFFGFTGNATLSNVTVTSGNGSAANSNSYGILFTRGGSEFSPLGTVVLNNVNVQGHVGKGALSFQQYSDISGVSLTDVNLSGCVAPWGQLILAHTDTDQFSVGNTDLKSLVLWQSGGADASTATVREAVTGSVLDRAVLADGLTAENQIVHKIDLGNLGLVNWKANNYFVTATSFAAPYTTAASVQRAIDAASAGDIVHVGPGTYAETVFINKGVTVKSTDGAATTTISGSATDANGSWAVRFGADNARLEGFTVSNLDAANGRAIAPAGFSGGAIVDNTIVNAFRGIQGDFYGTPTNLTISGNTFSSSVGYGIAGTENMTGLTITGNTFNTSQEGIGLGAGAGIASGDDVKTLRDAQTWALSGGYAIRDYRTSTVYVKGGTIQNAVSHANTVAGDTVEIAAGTYAESVVTTVPLTLQGTGATTIIDPVSGHGVTLAAGTDNQNRSMLKDVKITGADRGVNAGGYTTLDGVESTGNTTGLWLAAGTDLVLTDSKFNNNNLGVKIPSTVSFDGISITGSEFNNNTQHGWYSDANSANEPTMDNFQASNTTFSGNGTKGFYTERLSNATFDACTVSGNGLNGGGTIGQGIDINLKWRDYANISVTNSAFSGNGLGQTMGAALAIKGRDDGGTYGANPATLTGVTIRGNTFAGDERAIMLGEPAKSNAGPTDVTIEENSFPSSVLFAVVNHAVEPVEITCNWHNATGIAGLSATVSGEVEILSSLMTNTDGSDAAGFQPSGTCSAIGGCGIVGACNYVATLPYPNPADCEFTSCAGCMLSNACNYDATATIQANSLCQFLDALGVCGGGCTADADDNGVCDNTQEGCTNAAACNFDPAAGVNATSGPNVCEFTSCAGCTIPNACNYDATATLADPLSCVFAIGCDTCNEGAVVDGDTDNDGVCNSAEVLGCTVSNACNYNPLATDDSGNCEFTSCAGCANSFACNYDATVTIANNASCTFPASNLVDCNGDCLNDTNPANGVCDELEVVGCMDNTATNYNPLATVSGTCNTTVVGCMLPWAPNYNPAATVQGTPIFSVCYASGSPAPLGAPVPLGIPTGCSDVSACNYAPGGDPAAPCDYACFGCTNPSACDYSASAVYNTGCSDFTSCYGCTDVVACNYEADNTFENGTCEYATCAGCTDATACNYDATATINMPATCIIPDGVCDSCAGGLIVDNDTDNDGVCNSAEVPGCTNATACNYNASATDEDGSCQFTSCAGCMDPTACNYAAPGNALGITINEITDCVYATGCDSCSWAVTPSTPNPGTGTGTVVDGDVDNNNVCDALEIVGCTNPAACDYNPSATQSGTCDLVSCVGCTNPSACNYDENATQLDPTACTFATPGFDCDGNCLDINNNTICDNLESPLLGCIDATACDYNPAANTQDPLDACDFLLFQGFTSVVPASSDRTPDGALVPSIGGTGGSGTYFLRVTPIASQPSSTGNKVYNVSLVQGYAEGAQLGSSAWSQMFPGRYRFELVDDAGCEAVDTYPVVIPVLRAAN